MSEPARVIQTELHAVVFSGKLLPDQTAARVRARLQAALKMNREQVERLFAGTPVTVRRGLSWAEAMKYQTVFRKLGAVLTIHPDLSPPPAPTAATRPPAAPVAALPTGTPPPKPGRIERAAPAALPVRPTKPARKVAPRTPQPVPARRRIAPEAITMQDQLRLNLTAAAMLVLPLLYLGGLALIARLLYGQLVDQLSLFTTLNPVAALPLYVLPALALTLLGFLWLEPILQVRGDADEGIALDAEAQTELYAWCARLCHVLEVPPPTRIRLHLGSASSVELRNGLTSLWHQELELSLAASQLVGLSAPQLACTVGHELARFAQWRVMKLAYLIDGVHTGFAHGVEGESRLAAPLHRLADSENEHLALAGNLGQVTLAWLRLPLTGLMRLSAFLSRPVLRELAFRADRATAQLHGPALSAEALLQAAWLSEADELAETKNWQAWAEGQLVDDRVLLTLRCARQSENADLAPFRQELLAEEPSRWSRLPTIGERLSALAELPPDSGVCTGEPSPLPQLRDFPSLSRRLTEACYAAHGIGPQQGRRIGSAQMLTLTQEQDEALAATDRYFNGWHRAERFLALPGMDTLIATENAQKAQFLQEAVDKLRHKRPDIERVYAQYDAARSQVRQLMVARARQDAGDLGAQLERSRVDNALEGARAAQNGRLLDIQSIESLFSQRLAWALALTLTVDNKTRLHELEPVFAALRGLHRLQPALDELEQTAGIADELSLLPGLRTNVRLARQLRQKQTALREQLQSLHQGLSTLTNPLGRGDLAAPLDLSAWAPSQEPELAELLSMARGLREQLAYLNRRLTGRLARLAEPSEARFCLRPLRARLSRTSD